MKPNSVQSSVKSARSASRCQYLTATGRRCCSLAVEPVSGLCQRHADAQERLDKVDHSAVLTRFSRGFQTVEGINFALGDLYVLLAQGRISPRRAAVLTHMAALMLRTLPLMRRNFGKYEYRLIGSARPPHHDHVHDDDEHANQDDELDEPQETEAEIHEAHQDRAVAATTANLCKEADYSVPPGTTPLPATRDAFLDAIGKAKAAAEESEVELIAPTGGID